VKDKIARSKARLQVQEKHDEVDDLRNTGKTLKQIAEQLKLTFKEVAAADRSGMAPDGKPALETADISKVMEMAFATDAGSDQPSSDLSDGSYAWVNLLSTEAPKQKPFEEVKEQVKAQYIESERTRLISELAAKLVERINNGDPMIALEGAAGSSLQKTEAITRTTVPQGLSESAVVQAFALQPNKAGSAESADKQSRTILRVAEVTPAPTPSKEDLDKIAKQVEPELTNQTLTEYTEALKTRLGASINEAELKRALGTTEE
jgi:peptidyl-prolyl cis-trans isomerase D